MTRIFLCLASAALVLAHYSVGRASESSEFVDLIGGGTQQCCGYTYTAFSSAQMEAMTDANLATGFTYTSHRGEFTANQTEGIWKQFNFDVSGFSAITQIDLSWTGRYLWANRNSIPTMRIGTEPTSSFITFGGFDNANFANGNIVTGTRAFTGTSIPYLVANGIASPWVTTTLSTSISHEYFTVETLEISARVTGILIPEPSAAVLTAVCCVGLAARRTRRKQLLCLP